MQQPDKNSAGYVATLLKSVRPYRKRLLIGLTAVVVTAVFEVTGPMILRAGVDALNAGKPLSWLYIFAGLLILIAAIGGVFRFIMRYFVIGVSRFAESDLRERFFSHLLSLSPSFFDDHHTGDLMARATDDLERMRMVLGPALLYSVNTVLIMCFSGAMMIYLDVYLAMMILLLAPLIGGVVLIIARLLHQANLRQQETYGRLTTLVQENISGNRLIKAFVREQNESKRFGDICSEYFKRSLDVARLDAVFMPSLGFLIGLGIVGILWIGGQRVIAEFISLGDFIAFLAYLSIMTWPMIALGWVTHLYQRGGASFERLDQILSVPSQFSNEVSSENSFDSVGIIAAPAICFENISFRYRSEGHDVFTDLNLEIPAGKTIAIVGRTASGKSTLVRLLTRLYEPQSGRINLNDMSWDSLPIVQLRRLIGYVDQTPFLFSDTIRNNLTFGMSDIDEQAVERAACAACFDGDIADFPDKYETRIGERGVTLSGGQQQRLILARALILDTPILVLDDCLSAVDTETEKEILDRLSQSVENRTTIFITHRLAAAESADIIAVISGGNIIETGSHTKLMALDGYYAAMYRRQRMTEELGAMS